MDNCIFCGDQLDKEGKCVNNHSFKKMCINCSFSSKNEDGTYTCMNEENRQATLKKMIEAVKGVSESYEIKEFDIAPLPLKKPLLKCGKWALSDDVLFEMKKLFV